MPTRRFQWFAWATLAYNVAVIVWGAYVRATGSGAGCGSHWPLCNGEVIPRAPAIETIVEFSHRLTSGVALLLVVALVVWAQWTYRAHQSRRLLAATRYSLFFMLLEALVGASLVLLELVGTNESVARAIFFAVHSVNTFLLLACLTAVVWFARGGTAISLRGQGLAGWALSIGLIGMILLGATGAVTALGATLFPVDSLAEGLQRDLAANAHYLEQVRIVHPLTAIVVSLYVAVLARWNALRGRSATTARLSNVLIGLIATQFVIGMANIGLHAPVAMQLIHLLMADLLWIALIMFSLAVLARQPVAEAEAARTLQPAAGG